MKKRDFQPVNVRKYLPTKTLQPFIQSILVIESELGTSNRILPNSSIVLSFRIRGSISYVENSEENPIPLIGLAGLRRRNRWIRYSPGSCSLLVIFREGFAAGFFPLPMHEIFGTNLALKDFMGQNQIREIEDKLSESDSDKARIDVVEKFLLTQLQGEIVESSLAISESLRRIRAHKGSIPIRKLMEGMTMSIDSFEKKFRSFVGTTPKHYSGIVRMRNLIQDYSLDRSLTDMAYQAGYFDQAHFIRDFRNFTGEAPKSFFRSADFW